MQTSLNFFRVPRQPSSGKIIGSVLFLAFLPMVLGVFLACFPMVLGVFGACFPTAGAMVLLHHTSSAAHSSSSSAGQGTVLALDQQQRRSSPPLEDGDEEDDHDDADKKRKKRNPRACSVCGHYLAAWPDSHKQTQLRNQKLKAIPATTTAFVDNSNCNNIDNSSTSDNKKGSKSRTWHCTNTDEKLPKDTKYVKGQCTRQCTVCKLFLESLSSQTNSVAKKKKV
jgi:hypothetical protein